MCFKNKKNKGQNRYNKYKKRKNNIFLKYILFPLLKYLILITIIIISLIYPKFFNKYFKRIPKIILDRTELIDNYLPFIPEKYH